MTDVYYLQFRSATELRLLRDWIAAHGDPDAEQILVGSDGRRDPSALAARLEADDDPELTPLSVAWLPRERDGERVARLRDVLAEGDPRSPRPSQHALLVRRDPGRAVVAVGAAAHKSELVADFHASPTSTRQQSLGDYAAERAAIAMQRAEAAVHGPAYKVPRLVADRVRSSMRFQRGVARMALDLDRPVQDVLAAADANLHEMVAGFGPTLTDLSMAMGRTVRRQGYDVELDYDHEQAQRMAERIRDHSIVLLPTHRSNFDSVVMPTAWHELGLPPTHTLAGDNMAFWPIGPIMKRSGAIFIRRETKSDPVYRMVLREYIGYLVEKRFPLEWYIEGGRSRTGKLLPPKLGLLKYVVAAYRQGRTDDVMLVPASIAYDQLREVDDFAGEARGIPKQKESIGWALGYLKSSPRRYGRIYVRFGEPLSLREFLGPPEVEGSTSAEDDGAGHADQPDLALQKIAFEVATRINGATPITAAALVTLALLGGLGRALTFEQVSRVVAAHHQQATRLGLPLTRSAESLGTEEGLRAALSGLVDNGVVEFWGAGPEPVYRVGPDQHLAAAFYRNSLIHHVLDDSIAQLALVAAAGSPDVEKAFWQHALRLRDLLKFDFFFRDKEAFRAGLARMLDREVPDWRQRLSDDPDGAVAVLHRLTPLTAHLTLRSFLEAYSVVAADLGSRGAAPAPEPSEMARSCTGLGRQWLMQALVRSPESVSKQLFETGISLAGNLGLLVGGPQQPDHRAAFAEELRSLLGHLDRIEAVAGGSLDELLGVRPSVQPAETDRQPAQETT